ncbi:hypothetical protein Peur_031873 [Populus x canadensis]|uniref:loganic acid O-methyltransferase-like n=1 Tax=Populus nigra TaxID=3691 RepID=UPI002B2672E7|nr:loganic acid O-methyltransferase-like [Populus nigra]
MASTASPMASQLRSSFASSSTKRLAVPKHINIGATSRISPAKRSFIIKAVQIPREMEAIEEYPMNGGHGIYSYARNSYRQGQAINAVKELIKEEITEKLDINKFPSSDTFRIVDMGCSAGPNTFFAVQNVLEAVEKKYQREELDRCRLPEFQVFFNDHSSNDFNTLFTSLPPNRNYYVAGVPGSFHVRLFPEASLHIVISSYAIQWISHIPKELVDRSSPAWNKGRTYYAHAGAETIKAYADQFAKDMDNFFHFRAQEVVPGGMVLLTIPGGRLDYQILSNTLYDLLESTIVDLAKKGIISEEKLDSFNVPQYFPSPQEMEAAVKRNGCFSIERIECLHDEKKQANPKEARVFSSHMRAGLEFLLSEHFGHEIMDELFDLFTKKIEECEVFDMGVAFKLLVVLKRK